VYPFPNIVRVFKSKRMRWDRNVVLMYNIRNASKFYLENSKGIGHLEDLGLDGKIILNWIL
jgi:hypothetical protein